MSTVSLGSFLDEYQYFLSGCYASTVSAHHLMCA